MPRVTAQNDDGFSLVEMIIAMFLLMVLALALLPLMIGVANSSSSNTQLIAATTFANAQLAPIRAAYPVDSATTSCGDVDTALRRTADPDPAGTGLSADVTVGGCPADYPGTVSVTVSVYLDGEPGAPLVTVPTLILVAQS